MNYQRILEKTRPVGRALTLRLPALVLASGLFWPLIAVVSRGITLTGMYEESLGYRYFYSLRQIHDDHPYVFLPQGQIIDLAHQLIQGCLTLAGYPPENLFPRIDVFSYISLALPYCITVVAFSVFARRLPTLTARVLAALWLLIPYYDRGLYGYYFLLQPDYFNWIWPAGLVSVVLYAGLHEDAVKAWTWRDALTLGLFAALAAALKVTLVVYPASVALTWLVARPGFRKSCMMAVVAIATAVAGYLIILLALHHGDLSYVGRFFQDQRRFLASSASVSMPYSSWVATVVRDRWLIGAAALCPFLIALLLYVVRRRTWVAALAGLGLGSLVCQLLLYMRFSQSTRFEAVVFTFCLGLSVFSLALPRLPSLEPRVPAPAWRSSFAPSVFGPVWLLCTPSILSRWPATVAACARWRSFILPRRAWRRF